MISESRTDSRRPQPHPSLVLTLVGTALAWLLLACWAAWNYPTLAAITNWPLGHFLGIPLFGGNLLIMLFLVSQNLIFICSGMGRANKHAQSSPRPQWTHDLPLILMIIAWIGMGWSAMGTPPLTLASDVRIQIAIIEFAILMIAAFLLCARIVTRYGLASDTARPML